MALQANDVLQGLIEIAAEETGFEAGVIEPGSSFVADLDVDSLSMMTIVTLAEERFSAKIPDEAIGKLVTIQDAVDFIVEASA